MCETTVNLWGSPAHALEYLARADAIPHRTEGEAALLECLPRPLRRVLDLGSGDGRLLALVKLARPDARAVALDFSETMLDRLRARFEPTLRSASSRTTWTIRCPPRSARSMRSSRASPFTICRTTRKRALYEEVYRLLGPRGVFCNLEHVASPTAALHEQFLASLDVDSGRGRSVEQAAGRGDTARLAPSHRLCRRRLPLEVAGARAACGHEARKRMMTPSRYWPPMALITPIFQVSCGTSRDASDDAEQTLATDGTDFQVSCGTSCDATDDTEQTLATDGTDNTEFFEFGRKLGRRL